MHHESAGIRGAKCGGGAHWAIWQVAWGRGYSRHSWGTRNTGARPTLPQCTTIMRWPAGMSVTPHLLLCAKPINPDHSFQTLQKDVELASLPARATGALT